MSSHLKLRRTDNIDDKHVTQSQLYLMAFNTESNYRTMFPDRILFKAKAYHVKSNNIDTLGVSCTKVHEDYYVFAIEPWYWSKALEDFGIDRSSIRWSIASSVMDVESDCDN